MPDVVEELPDVALRRPDLLPLVRLSPGQQIPDRAHARNLSIPPKRVAALEPLQLLLDPIAQTGRRAGQQNAVAQLVEDGDFARFAPTVHGELRHLRLARGREDGVASGDAATQIVDEREQLRAPRRLAQASALPKA